MELAMERERVRAVRFSNQEIEVLLDLIKTHMIIENKRIDSSTKAVKGKAWGYITAEFRSRTLSKRTELQLWKKWKNLKHAARKYDVAMNSKDKSSLQQGYLPRSPILEEVLDVLQREREVLAKNSREIDSTMFISSKIKVEESYDHSEAVSSSLSSEENSSWLQESCNYPQHEAYVNNGIKLCPGEADVMVEAQQTAPTTQYIIPTRIAGNLTSRNVIDHDENSSDDAISVDGYSVSSENNYTSDANNEINLCPVEADVMVETRQSVPTALETQYIVPAKIIGNLKARNILDSDGNSTEDAVSVEGYSVSSERNYNIDSSVQPETEPQLNVNHSECSSLSVLVLEKELALKSAQLALLEKENQIKDLDIRIREEQLTDIIIWRNREQELHELKKQEFS